MPVPHYADSANNNCPKPVTDVDGLPVKGVAGTAIIGKVGIDQTTDGTTNGVVLKAGENFVGFTGGKAVVAGGSFTRPADTTAYASADLVANSTTAGSVTPIMVAAGRVNDGTGMIRRVRLKKSNTSTTNASFRVHFYKDSPTCANGDNAAWSTTESNYLGAVDITMDKAFTDGAKGIGSPNTGSEINYVCSSGTPNIYALIEARAAYTPVSGETFTLACEVLQN